MGVRGAMGARQTKMVRFIQYLIITTREIITTNSWKLVLTTAHIV